MSIERQQGNAVIENREIPPEEQADAETSPVTAQEMAEALEMAKDAIETATLESPAVEEPGISSEALAQRQEDDKNEVEALRESLRESAEQSQDSADGGSGNEFENGTERGGAGKGGMKMAQEYHAKYKPCEACKGSGKKWFFFNCPVCHGSGAFKESETTKTQVEHGAQSSGTKE